MTPFTDLVGCSLPIQQAAMSRIATPALAAAVSNAGGLGMLAVGRPTREAVLAELDTVAELTDRPVGAGFVVEFLDRAILEAVAERLPVVEFFWGRPDAGVLPDGPICGWQVGSVDEARQAIDAGCRYVIAQGVEAGGHVRGTLPLTELVPAVVEVADRAGVAVVAAGGIGTAADVRAALALGAHAVRIGTRFVATDESDAHERYVERLAAADADDTVLTEAFEVSWPNAPHRVLASCVAAAADAAPGPVAYVDEATGSTPLDRYGTRPPTRWTRGDIDAMAMYAGQGVGAVRGRVPVAALIAELMAELVGGAAT